jgi:hypothetical protein
VPNSEVFTTISDDAVILTIRHWKRYFNLLDLLSTTIVQLFTFFFSKMVDYTPNEIVNMIVAVGKCRNNFKAAARLYHESYPDRQAPNHSKLLNMRSTRLVIQKQKSACE